jgi:hypothetical protein
MGMGNEGSDNEAPPNLDDLISLNQAAQLSGLSPSHIRLLVRKGIIWGKKMGRDWFTSAQSIQDYLKQNRKPGPKVKA